MRINNGDGKKEGSLRSSMFSDFGEEDEETDDVILRGEEQQKEEEWEVVENDQDREKKRMELEVCNYSLN